MLQFPEKEIKYLIIKEIEDFTREKENDTAPHYQHLQIGYN